MTDSMIGKEREQKNLDKLMKKRNMTGTKRANVSQDGGQRKLAKS